MAKTGFGGPLGDLEPPRLPKLFALRNLPNPAELAGDIGDTVLDVVTVPAETVRALKISAKAAKNEVVSAIKSGSAPPEPAKLLSGIVDAVVAPITTGISQIQARLRKYAGK